MATEGALIVFARAPRAGEVKSRLAAKIGAIEAAAVYARLLSQALRLAEGVGFGWRYLFAADRSAVEYFEHRLDPYRWYVVKQCDGDIGRRMHRAFETVLSQRPFAVLMGSDVADCTPADLERARDLLSGEKTCAVIGPCVDGGYWLLGLREVHASFFDAIPWGTPSVLAMTQERLAAAALTPVSLPPRHDIDEVDDLRFLSPCHSRKYAEGHAWLVA